MSPIVYLIVGLVAGILAGIAIGWLFARLKAKPDASGNVEVDKAKLENKIGLLEQELNRQTALLEKHQEELSRERNKYTESEKNTSRLEAENKAIQDKLNDQKLEIENLQKKFTLEFENIANKLLDQKSEKFVEQNKTQLDIILNPLKEKIVSFEKKVEETQKEEIREKASLKQEIKNLFDLNQKISQEANNLVTALKGSNKSQGNWGEMILEKILEASGLTEGQEYKREHSTTNEDGKTLRPDVVIMLPDEKNLVIDSKVSLIHYEQYVNAESDEDRQKFLKQHIDSIRIHIKGLGDKNYTELAGVKTPDFVLLFIPVEASFAAAMQHDHDLYSYAWDKKIVLVSPTTLLATLRTVASVWKQEKQVTNALQIAKEAGNMYDKFVAFSEDLLDVGKRMDDAKKSYSNAMNKLVEGKGNLIKRAQDLQELGAKTSKKFGDKLLDRSNQNLFESKNEDDEK